MSQLSFSHQFSVRWREAPEAVRRAIVQELEDIVTLLNPETNLDDFKFRHADLNDEIERIYATLASQAESQNDVMPQVVDNADDVSRVDNNDNANKDQPVPPAQIQVDATAPASSNVSKIENDALSVESAETDDKVGDEANAQPAEPVEAMHETSSSTAQTQTAPLSPKREEAMEETMLAELERKIDDYLSEQMAVMSEDLKAWLREELSK